MYDQLIHRFLRVPYTLHVRHLRRPRHPKATLLFIHGLGNTGNAWDDVIEGMPANVRIIAIDLLGFGSSQSPSWAVYDAKTQAKSVLATLIKLRIGTPTIVVGHSVGALVAIEMAKRYPLLIDQLILCSPPLFKTTEARIPRTDNILRQFFMAIEQHPDRSLRLAAFVTRYKLVNDSFNLTNENIESYMSALHAMIINQTSLDDAYGIRVPTTIIKGRLDPFIVTSNLNTLRRKNKNVTIKSIFAGHELKGRYVKAVIATIKSELGEIEKNKLHQHIQ